VQLDARLEHRPPPAGQLHLAPLRCRAHRLEARGQLAMVARLRLRELGGVGAEEDLQDPGEAELAVARLGLGKPGLQRLNASRVF